jgi:hypothetical protein
MPGASCPNTSRSSSSSGGALSSERQTTAAKWPATAPAAVVEEPALEVRQLLAHPYVEQASGASDMWRAEQIDGEQSHSAVAFSKLMAESRPANDQQMIRK